MRAYVGVGSNLGDRRATLDAATAQLAGAPQTTLVAASSWYETVAVGGPLGQDPFLNGCLLLETALAPEALLDRLLEIETALGRVREIPWGPRTLDLDLLLYDDAVIHSPRLTVPHPRAFERSFVLAPWLEIAPNAELPGHGSVAELLAACSDSVRVYAAEPLFVRPGVTSKAGGR